MREWIAETLVVFSYYSVPDSSKSSKRFAFQVLSFEQKTVVVDTFQTRIDASVDTGLFAMIQPLEEMDRDPADPSVIDTFIVEDPLKIDILRLIGTDSDNRLEILRWKCGVSPLENCFAL